MNKLKTKQNLKYAIAAIICFMVIKTIVVSGIWVVLKAILMLSPLVIIVKFCGRIKKYQKEGNFFEQDENGKAPFMEWFFNIILIMFFGSLFLGFFI